MNGVYYIKNTVDEFHEDIKGYFNTLDDAKKALKTCRDWYRPYGTGRIYWIDFGLNKKPMLIHEKRLFIKTLNETHKHLSIMTREDKELLLKDLCSRLPYGVVCNTSKGNGHLCSINQTIFGIEYGINIKATERDYFNDREEITKPYLRPMSSMTEEENKEYKQFLEDIAGCTYSIDCVPLIDWLNRHHFDYRGLIKKGLAIDATGLNIY